MSRTLFPSAPIVPDLEPAAQQTLEASATATLTPRTGRFALFLARAFLAFGWLRAGSEKVIVPDWWTGAELETFLAEQRAESLPFVTPLVDAIVAPAPAITAAVVALGELALGVALLTGKRLQTALLAACGLNVAFVAMGVVTPSAFYLVIQLTLLLWTAEARGWFSPARRLGAAAGCGAAAVLLTPFITTLHPAEVIEDPAIMLATLGGLIAATQVLSLVDERLNGSAGALSSPT